MANSGVVVVVSGQDNTEKVFQAIEANLKRTTERAHETESALGELGESAKRSLEAIGISVGIREVIDGLKEVVQSSLEYGEKIEQAGRKTGLTAETLSTLHYAASITGSDFDQVSNAVARFDKMIGDAADGNKKAESFMKALGLNATELAGRSDGAEVAFKKFTETMAATENPIRRAQLAQDLLGKAGKELIPVLQEIGENYDGFKQKAEEAGLLLNDKTAAALKAQEERLRELQLRAQGAGLAFTEGLIPAFTAMLSVMTGGKNALDTWNTLGKDLGKTLAFLGEMAYEFASGLEAIFGVSEALIPGLGNAAKKDLDAAMDLARQAQKMHEIAFGPDKKLDTETAGEGSGDKKHGHGFEGVPDTGEANKLDSARKARDAAQLRLDEQMAQLRAQQAKASEELQLAQLEDDHKRNLVSDADFYAQKLALQRAALDQQRQAAVDKQAQIDAGIGKLEADAKKQGGAVAVEDQAKILELRTKRLALDGEIAKINADAAKAEIAAAQLTYELSIKQTQQVDELAAKREAMTGGDVTARLQQSADSYDIRRKDLLANYGEGSKPVSDADFAFTVEQDQIRAKGAEETSGLATSGINARRQAIGDAQARGSVTTLDAQRQRIALDQEEAQALQPVLRAYQQLADEGDLQAAEKVVELKTRISELQNPVDEVAAHIRESFDGAFESLFENLDQGIKGFENFAKSIERIVEQAAYKKFIEPMVQKGLDALIPNKPGYGDPGVGGVGAVPANPNADVGGGAVKSALGSVGGFLGIPGLGGFGKQGSGKTITIVLENAGAPLNIKDVQTQGNVDSDQVETIIRNSFDSGGFMRQLLTGFGGGSD